MASYWDVLDAVRKTVEEMASLKERAVRITVRKAPVLVPQQDSFPQLVIAPRADLAEVNAGRTSESAWWGYETFIGLFLDARWDAETLQWRLERREEFRAAFLPPKSLFARTGGAVWNVLYDPSPSVPGGGAPDNIDGSWQKLTFIEKRSKGFS